MLWLAEDDRAHGQGSASRGEQSALDIYPRLRRLQSGAHAKPGRRSSGGVRSEPRCVSSRIELEAEATKTPEIKPFNIVNDEQQKEKPASNQFFGSLLERTIDGEWRLLH
jgi:hypothetical protein